MAAVKNQLPYHLSQPFYFKKIDLDNRGPDQRPYLQKFEHACFECSKNMFKSYLNIFSRSFQPIGCSRSLAALAIPSCTAGRHLQKSKKRNCCDSQKIEKKTYLNKCGRVKIWEHSFMTSYNCVFLCILTRFHELCTPFNWLK